MTVNLHDNNDIKFYENMYLIRNFEEKLLKLFEEGKVFGTTHAYIGQEANAVGVISNINDDDIVVSNHRCHGHYLAFKNNAYALLSEMMGKKDGLCAGRGGSQHLCDGNFFTNGVQGGIMPLACGLSFAQKEKKSGKIVVVFIGDGTLGEGVVYETLNILSKWELPLLIVVENNKYAQSTKVNINLAGKILDRFKAFSINVIELSTFDVQEIYDVAKNKIKYVRTFNKPSAIILNTYRFSSHSKSDDGRDKNEVFKWRKKDCLKIIEKRNDKLTIDNIRFKVNDNLERAFQKSLIAPLSDNIE